MITVIALVILTPVLATVAALIRIFLGTPVLFRQERPGLYGRPFTIVKFRTMNDARNLDGTLLPDADRLSTFGRVLRSTSLDELPELWNIIMGDMSLVGPRPLLVRYLERYDAEQARRHSVLPGLTGWAQVNGRNDISWEEKFSLDVWYVDHVSFWLDVEILALTVWKTIKREGINQEGHVTMQEFWGSKQKT